MRRRQLTPKVARALVAERAGTVETEAAYWLNHPIYGGGCEDYCRTCVEAVCVLPGLAVCSLLRLLGVDVMAPQAHEMGEPDSYGYQHCSHCEKTRRTASSTGTIRWSGHEAGACRSWPERIQAQADASRDGGWATEHDGLRSCSFCGVELTVNLTDEGVEEEIDHWRHHGPPSSPYGWWEFNEVLEAFGYGWRHPLWPTVLALLTRWRIRPLRRRSDARALKLARLARKPRCWCGRVAVVGHRIWDANKGAPMLRCRGHVPLWPGQRPKVPPCPV